MNREDMAALVRMADELDKSGQTKEAQALDAVLVRVAEEEKAMSNKAMNALRQLHKACSSFCNKNLDSRGGNRRKMNKICDLAEDLCEEIAPLLGE